MDFNIKEPVIQFTLDEQSTDLSDQTLRYFIECAANRGLEVLWPFSHEQNRVKPQLRIKQEITDIEAPSIRVDNVSQLFLKFLKEKGISHKNYPNFVKISYFGEENLFEFGEMWGEYKTYNIPTASSDI